MSKPGIGSGRRALKRHINGMLLLDKPTGISSNGALQRARYMLEARKGGHTGNLDPIATGLLPLCFGETTRISGFFLDADKRYWTRIKLGEATNTQDREGEVIFSSDKTVSAEALLKEIDRFRGQFEQTPPMFSAIKKNGQPLYKLARKGIEVEREARPVNVYNLEVKDFDGQFVEVEIACSRGFYVRSLANDLGEALGVGGHVVELRRLGVGELDVADAVTLEEFDALGDPSARAATLLGSDSGLGHLPKVDLSVDATFYIVRGQSVSASNLPDSGWVRLYSSHTGFLGLGEITDDGQVAPKRLFTKTRSVSPRSDDLRTNHRI
ncbi:MAG: tRNA pseudouridine synthase B [marine bacterium B5-7]|nr:MAG: tRNA pseudouridine synthase B [marine bacterium B5-7]